MSKRKLTFDIDIRDLQKKPVYWVEVYNRSLKEWVTVDVTRKKVRCQGDMEPNKTDETNKMAYVVAIEQGTFATD